MAVTDTLSAVHRPIYDRKYPHLKRVSWPWRILATYTSFMLWLASTPWLAIRALAPFNFQDNLHDIETSWLSFITPIVNFAQDMSFKAFAITDSAIDWTINTGYHVWHHYHKDTLHAFEHLLRNVEHRVRILKDEGFNGITKALSFGNLSGTHMHTAGTHMHYHGTGTHNTGSPITDTARAAYTNVAETVKAT